MTLFKLNLKPQMYLNTLIRSDSVARLGSLYMATIKEKESIVGLLRVACSTSLGVNKVTVWKAVLVRKCETLVVFLIRGQSSARLLLFSYVGQGARLAGSEAESSWETAGVHSKTGTTKSGDSWKDKQSTWGRCRVTTIKTQRATPLLGFFSNAATLDN